MLEVSFGGAGDEVFRHFRVFHSTFFLVWDSYVVAVEVNAAVGSVDIISIAVATTWSRSTPCEFTAAKTFIVANVTSYEVGAYFVEINVNT